VVESKLEEVIPRLSKNSYWNILQAGRKGFPKGIRGFQESLPSKDGSKGPQMG